MNENKTSTNKNVIVASYNFYDGIGDIINGFDVYQSLQKESPGLNLFFIGFITNDKVSSLLKSDHELNNKILFIKQNDRINLDSENKIYIFETIKGQTENVYEKIINHHPGISSFFKQCNYFINVATPLGKINKPQAVLHENCQIMTIRELGCTSCDGLEESYSFTEQGRLTRFGFINKKDAGYKINKKQIELLEIKNQAEAFKSFKNENLKKLVFAKNNSISMFKENNDLLIGYSQDKTVSNISLDIFINISNKLNLFCIINTDHISTEKLLELIQKFSNLTVYSILKNEKKEYQIDKSLPYKRNLTIIDFKGIAHHDKLFLLSIAKVGVGSGDNSYSETLFSEIPFFHIPLWKISYFVMFLKFLRDNKFNTLAEYIKLQLNLSIKNYEFVAKQELQKLNNFVLSNQSNIISEWKNLREKIINEHDFNQFIIKLGASIKNNASLYQNFTSIEEKDLESELNLVNTTMLSSLNYVPTLQALISKFIVKNDYKNFDTTLNEYTYSYNFYIPQIVNHFLGDKKELLVTPLVHSITNHAPNCMVLLLLYGADPMLPYYLLLDSINRGLVKNPMEVKGSQLFRLLIRWANIKALKPETSLANLLIDAKLKVYNERVSKLTEFSDILNFHKSPVATDFLELCTLPIETILLCLEEKLKQIKLEDTKNDSNLILKN